MHRAVVFVDQPFVVKLFKNPPDRLHERFIHSAVRILHVGPAADAWDYLFPLRCVSENTFTAAFVEFRDTHLEYLFFVFETELFLNDVFYRESVAVPPPHARHVVAAHCPIARHHVLDDGSHDVAVMRKSCRKWWPIVEHIVAFWGRFFKRFFENSMLVPEFKNLLLALRDFALLFFTHATYRSMGRNHLVEVYLRRISWRNSP